MLYITPPRGQTSSLVPSPPTPPKLHNMHSVTATVCMPSHRPLTYCSQTLWLGGGVVGCVGWRSGCSCPCPGSSFSPQYPFSLSTPNYLEMFRFRFPLHLGCKARFCDLKTEKKVKLAASLSCESGKQFPPISVFC